MLCRKRSFGLRLIVVCVRRKYGTSFFKIRFSSSSLALRFWSSLIWRPVRARPSSVLTVEYCLIHLAGADYDTPYSLQSEDCVLPFL